MNHWQTREAAAEWDAGEGKRLPTRDEQQQIIHPRFACSVGRC